MSPDLIRCFKGGPTSAAMLNRRAGRRDNNRWVYVEGGKRMSWSRFLREMNEAADACLRRRGVRA